MLGLRLSKGNNHPYTILCLGAHADDIEMGCGGTILKLLKEYPNLAVYWVVFSGSQERRQEACKSAGLFLEGVQRKTVEVKSFKDGFFPYLGAEIKDYFEQLKTAVTPDLIFTHFRQDRHQDHRLISDLTWNTYRGQFILEYEIPKYDGDLGIPNVFVALDEAVCRQKVAYIQECFMTQHGKHWFTEDTFFSLLRLRGIECAHTYAEAYHCRKMILQ